MSSKSSPFALITVRLLWVESYTHVASSLNRVYSIQYIYHVITLYICIHTPVTHSSTHPKLGGEQLGCLWAGCPTRDSNPGPWDWWVATETTTPRRLNMCSSLCILLHHFLFHNEHSLKYKHQIRERMVFNWLFFFLFFCHRSIHGGGPASCVRITSACAGYGRVMLLKRTN